MLSTKQISQIRNMLAAIIENVIAAKTSLDTIAILDTELNRMILHIRQEHGDSEAHAIAILFTEIKKEKISQAEK